MASKSKVASAFADMQGEKAVCVINEAALHTACLRLGLQSDVNAEMYACESLGLGPGSEIQLDVFQTLLVGLGLDIDADGFRGP